MQLALKALREQGALGDAVRTAGSFNNQLKKLGGTLGDLGVEIGASLISGAREAVAAMNRGAEAAIDWVRANRDLVASIGAITLATGGVGAGLFALGEAAEGVAAAVFVIALAVGKAGGIVPLLTKIATIGARLFPLGAALTAIGVGMGQLALGARHARQASEALDELEASIRRANKAAAESDAGGDRLTKVVQNFVTLQGFVQANLDALSRQSVRDLHTLERAAQAIRPPSRIEQTLRPFESLQRYEQDLHRLARLQAQLEKRIRAEVEETRRKREEAAKEVVTPPKVKGIDDLIDERKEELRKQLRDQEITEKAELQLGFENLDFGEFGKIIGEVAGDAMERRFRAGLQAFQSISREIPRALIEAGEEFFDKPQSVAVGQFGGLNLAQILGAGSGDDKREEKETNQKLERANAFLEAILGKIREGTGLPFI